jgi:hypothetical protein
MSHSRRVRSSWTLVLALLAVALQGCDDDTTAPGGALTVQAALAPGHLHAFETDATFTVTVTDAQGNAVRDFTTARVELSPAGAEQWTKHVPLLFDGAAYVGTTKFTAAGSFDARVLGQRPGQSGPVELHRSSTPISVVRAHFDAGGYRVEFETDTAEYPVAGQPITVRFPILENVPSPRPPVSGLTGVMIRCTQGSEVEVHAATESPAGVYSASHTFSYPGEGTAQIEFTGSDMNPAVVQIPLRVN